MTIFSINLDSKKKKYTNVHETIRKPEFHNGNITRLQQILLSQNYESVFNHYQDINEACSEFIGPIKYV